MDVKDNCLPDTDSETSAADKVSIQGQHCFDARASVYLHGLSVGTHESGWIYFCTLQGEVERSSSLNILKVERLSCFKETAAR